jgi:hypothetical protein
MALAGFWRSGDFRLYWANRNVERINGRVIIKRFLIRYSPEIGMSFKIVKC